ncbi:MAG: pyruvate dehydrogenase [Ilumatobacter sp.]|nr:pyruvate dehydrogenase [Ilumatobacter sp.]
MHPVDLDTLDDVQQRVLWLAARMIDHANRERPAKPGAVKVGGHQASSASMVSIMTALWFAHLSGDDKVAVKPHASPVYHSIKYLTGELDRSYLTQLRAFGGLQAYPSRTKDPDVADFSTGSVGLGAVAPLFAAMARRYIEAQFGPVTDRPARFIALVGDAELDEGNVWEAISDPALHGLGNVMWVVDANRQSLDRVIPDQKIKKLMEFFDGAGWHTVEAKYGALLQSAFRRPGGNALRSHIDDMANERYQSLFALRGSALRERFVENGTDELRAFVDDIGDDELRPLVTNLGGHDLGVLLDSYRQCDAVTDRPSVVFAYTIKGWGLPMAGDPLNHAALLTGAQIDEFRAELGLTAADEWDRFPSDTPAGRLCGTTGGELNNQPVAPRPELPIPEATGVLASRPVSTQETFGRVLTALANVEAVAPRMVTTSPDVSVSTNLGGWINKMGVFSPVEQPDFLGSDRLLRWEQKPAGQHVELGLSEMNLFLSLHAFGLAHDLHGQHLLPVGTVYDPFVCRGLDALIYALYNGARFVLAGTPAGVTLAPEGGAHQSSITPSIGLELPGLNYAEPAYADAVDWLLCDGLRRLATPDGASLYLRLSTRAIDQAPFASAAERLGADRLRAHVLAGGYRLIEPDGPADVVLAACGAVMPEAVAAATLLADEGVGAVVIDITSSDRLYGGWRNELRDAAASAQIAPHDHHLASLLKPAERDAPIITVHDAASHHLAWMGGVFGTRTVPVGVDEFGQSGEIDDLYRLFDLLPAQIANAALVAMA